MNQHNPTSPRGDYQFRSEFVDRPLESYGFWKRALLFAELAYVAYDAEASAAKTVDDVGLRETLFIQKDGSQAYVFRSPHDTIVACRGTEPHEWNDIRST